MRKYNFYMGDAGDKSRTYYYMSYGRNDLVSSSEGLFILPIMNEIEAV
jgi:hypothetical protein